MSIAALAAAARRRAAASQATDTDITRTVSDLGLIGVWAPDCAHTDRMRTEISIDANGQILELDAIGTSGNTYRYLDVHRLENGDLAERVLWVETNKQFDVVMRIEPDRNLVWTAIDLAIGNHQVENGRIVKRLKRGFTWHDRVLRAEEVIAKRFQ